ncbi:TolC family protein [Algisphaera agarilytica]|uniref:Outer membrane protein TolC n=1 Tax=Algisphaera agarilytica TaxID=1385975 RepID=A0A7X0HAN9_9BACT|nr:TolC family protein [Algisphaera agarilytica]MBB6431226.1 outer membrane protein TolC [Algisphaera agarilytica]
MAPALFVAPHVALTLCLGALLSCNQSQRMDRLELEAQRIIQDQQSRSIGPAAMSDTQVPTPDAQPKDSLYTYDPATVNTPARSLDVEAAPPVEVVPYPTILDDGTQPDTLRLDLEGIIAQAIEFAPDYRREKEDLFLTTLSLIVERHEWGPRFFSTITGQVDGTPEAGDNDTALSLIGSLGATQRLPYGGTISAAALVDYVRFLEQAATSTDNRESQSAELQFSLDLPLLRGAGKTAATVETRIQAERDLIYAVRGFERFRREFFVDLSTAYFDLLRRQGQLTNQEVQLRNFESSAELFTALAEAGREPYFQAQRAEQRVLRARNSLVRQQENYVRAIDALKLRIGIETTRPVEIIPVTIDVPEILLDTDRSVTIALTERLDLQTEGDLVEDAVRSVLIAKNQLLPDLDLNADLNLPTDENLARGGLDFEPGDGDYTVGLTFGVPLDRKIEYTDYRAALIRLEREQREYQVEQDRIALEVRRAVRAIEQARFILQLQERAVEINERRAEQIEINERSLGPREVIDVQEDLLDAKNDRDEAESDLRISILQYLLATGQMRIGSDGRWMAPGELIKPNATEDPGLDETPSTS